MIVSRVWSVHFEDVDGVVIVATAQQQHAQQQQAQLASARTHARTPLHAHKGTGTDSSLLHDPAQAISQQVKHP